MKSLLESLRDMEGKKRLLEAQIDDLNETCSQLKTKGLFSLPFYVQVWMSRLYCI